MIDLVVLCFLVILGCAYTLNFCSLFVAALPKIVADNYIGQSASSMPALTNNFWLGVFSPFHMWNPLGFQVETVDVDTEFALAMLAAIAYTILLFLTFLPSIAIAAVGTTVMMFVRMATGVVRVRRRSSES